MAIAPTKISCSSQTSRLFPMRHSYLQVGFGWRCVSIFFWLDISFDYVTCCSAIPIQDSTKKAASEIGERPFYIVRFFYASTSASGCEKSMAASRLYEL